MTVQSMADGGVCVSRAGDAFDFIDLARLGRTDWWSCLKALLKLVGWQLLIGATAGVALYFWEAALPPGFYEVIVLAVATAAWYVGLRGAVRRSHGRPMMSLVSADLRLRPGRIALGAAVWLAVTVAVVAAAGILYSAFGLRPPESDASLAGFSWPQSPTLILSALLCIALFPLQAAAEELTFRGWMTQTLGQFVRRRWLVALVVAVTFATAHGFGHGVFAFMFYVIISLGLSIFTFADGRLELAIGMHAANNALAALAGLMASAQSAHPTLLSLNNEQVPWEAPVLALIQLALAYAITRWLTRRGAAASDDAALTEIAD